MNIRSKRVSTWFQLLKSARILKTQSDFSSILKGGKGVSQSFISRVINGESPVPDSMIDDIIAAFPFTRQLGLNMDSEPLFDPIGLIEYLADKHNIDLQDIQSDLGLESIDNDLTDDQIQDVFTYFNKKYKYSLRINILTATKADIIIPQRGDRVAKSIQSRNVAELMEVMIKLGMAHNEKEFAETILECSAASIYNLKNNSSYDVTKNMLVALARNAPNVNLRWVLLDEGNMFTSISKDEIAELKHKQEEILNLLKKKTTDRIITQKSSPILSC